METKKPTTKTYRVQAYFEQTYFIHVEAESEEHAFLIGTNICQSHWEDTGTDTYDWSVEYAQEDSAVEPDELFPTKYYNTN